MQRVVVIGVDGATLDLMEPWMNKGELINFKKIQKNGVWGKLTSTIPSLSPPAWTSIVTGCNPGKHGIYGFRRTDRSGSHLVNSRYRKAPAIWNFLTDISLKSIIVNVPCTYPAEKINGIMITGMLTPSKESNFTYPPDIINKLHEKELGEYDLEHIQIEHFHRSLIAKHNPSKLIDKIIKQMNSRANVTINIMKKFDWDFTMVVLRGVDVVQHFLWHRKDLILSCYKRVDEIIGEMISKFPDAVFFIVSDHGFEKIKKIFYPDNVLYNAGLLNPFRDTNNSSMKRICYLIFLKISRRLLHILLSHTHKDTSLIRKIIFSDSSKDESITSSKNAAFCTAGGHGIQINRTVAESDYERIREKIMKIFGELRDPDSNEKISEGIYRWEEIYGKDAKSAPDIILRLKKGYTASEFIRSPENIGSIFKSKGLTLPFLFQRDTSGRSGDHALEGVFFAYGKGIKSNYKISNASVTDVMPTVFTAMNIPIPEDIDGRVHEDIFIEKVISKKVDWHIYSSIKKPLSDGEIKKIREIRNKFKHQK